MIGQTLGSYEILSPLGKGGMGEVWRARDQKLGREVAIKTLPEEFAKDEERLARFEREAKLLASLNHPNIAAIYGLEEHEGTRFLVLELVEGDTLAERLKRGAIPVEESLTLALQIAEALEAAHEKGVIHRDLKPLNIKVTPEGKIKVLDFGLAKAFMGDGADANLSQSPTLSMAATQQGVILGTAAYMSPEQARGQEVDKRADVWAFGVVLFEMLTGRGTFDGGTVSDVLAGVLAKEPRWDALPPNLHPRIRQLLDRCLEKEVNDRYHDIADARVDIHRVLADPDGVIAQPVGHVVGTRRSALPWIGAIVTFVMITALAVWNLKPSDPGSVTRFAIESPGLTNLPGVSSIALSPDGRRIVYESDGQLYLRAMDQMEATPIAGTEGGLYPFFSPDGRSVGFTTGTQLKTMVLPAGAPIVVAELDSGAIGGAWGDDGMIFFGQGGSFGLSRVSDRGGTPAAFAVLGDSIDLDFPDILPGVEWVIFTEQMRVGQWSQANIVAQSVTTGERKLLIEGGFRAEYVSTGHLVYVRDGALLAVGFDAGAVDVVTPPVTLVEGVLTNVGGAAHYAVSDTGTLAYVPVTGLGEGSSLALVARDGTVEHLNVRARNYRNPRISPDGDRLVVASLEDDGTSVLWVYDLSGEGQMRQLTFEGSSFDPVWTRDGAGITFFSARDGTRGIYTIRSDGGRAEPLTTVAGDRVADRHVPGAWSPDGETLVFEAISADARSIWSVSPGEEPKALYDSPDRQFGAPQLSPDGRWLAYTMSPVSGTSDSTDVYVEPFPPTGDVNRISLDGGFFPLWSLADGTALLYQTGLRAGPPHIESVDVRLLPDFSITEAEELSIPGLFLAGARHWDITPDGERFLRVVDQASLTVSGEPATPRIHIVLNWFEELKERVPVP